MMLVDELRWDGQTEGKGVNIKWNIEGIKFTRGMK
jgi:hypothetical protein